MNETLLTAARRLARFLRIDLEKGGIVQIETQQALDTLDKMINDEDRKAKMKKDKANEG